MTGRAIFQKYGKVIRFLVRVAKLFPISFRKYKLNSSCLSKGLLGQFRRYIWLGSIAQSIGDNVAVYPNVFFEHAEKLSIGNNVSIHQMCYIDAGGEIVIGDDVSIAHRTTILSSNHRYDCSDTPIKYQGMIHKKTIIDNNVWIGCSVTILAGVHVSSGCVIGANSVVTKDVNPDEIVVGNPARVIKKRFNHD